MWFALNGDFVTLIYVFNLIVMTTLRPLLVETVHKLKNPPLCKLAQTKPKNKFARYVVGRQVALITQNILHAFPG
jgi:hypothetical protein